MEVGQTIHNKKTGVRADVMVVYKDAPMVLVRTFPQDDSSNDGWHKWHIDDISTKEQA